jgi:hypothetical protein
VLCFPVPSLQNKRGRQKWRVHAWVSEVAGRCRIVSKAV